MKGVATWVFVGILSVGAVYVYGQRNRADRQTRLELEQEARGRYARLRLNEIRSGSDEIGHLEVEVARGKFVEACRKCLSAKACEQEARSLDTNPEAARLFQSCR